MTKSKQLDDFEAEAEKIFKFKAGEMTGFLIANPPDLEDRLQATTKEATQALLEAHHKAVAAELEGLIDNFSGTPKGWETKVIVPRWVLDQRLEQLKGGE